MPFAVPDIPGLPEIPEVPNPVGDWVAERVAEWRTPDSVAPPTPVPPGQSAPPAAGGGVLRLEPDQLDAAISVFEDALDSLELPVSMAKQSLTPGSTADDIVSREAAMGFGRAADPAVRAWSAAIDEIRSVIEQIQRAKQSQLDADAAGAASLPGPA